MRKLFCRRLQNRKVFVLSPGDRESEFQWRYGHEAFREGGMEVGRDGWCTTSLLSITVTGTNHVTSFSSIQLYLCSILNSRHCHKAALQEYKNSEYYKLYDLKFEFIFISNEQKILPKWYEEEILRWTRLKRKPILIWVKPDSD